MENVLENNVTNLKGIGQKRAEVLAKLNIVTLRDIFEFYPRAYQNLQNTKKIKDLVDGENAAVRAKLTTHVREKRAGKNASLTVFSFVVSDGESEMEITLFNQKYTAMKLKKDCEYIFYGRVDAIGFFKTLKSPTVESVENAVILPIYPLCVGVSQNMLRNIVKLVTNDYIEQIEESLPSEILQNFDIIPLKKAYKDIHFPQDEQASVKARERFIVEELFYFILGLNILKKKNRSKTSEPLDSNDSLQLFYNSLPFSLTNAQIRVINECLNDMKKSTAMARLLQGDVGSGKTVVAAALIYHTKMCGRQSAMMAPTEVLAMQHFESLRPIFEKTGVSAALLLGQTKQSERKIIHEKLRNGEIDVLIGTHALIQKDVNFKHLALIVTDEQHRFGVNQRMELARKGQNPHSLIMSATPIPRTLALLLYGDLDVSIIDELPAGRQKISSFVVGSDYHEKMYSYLREQVIVGSQAFVVCPLIEESDEDETRSVITFSEQLGEKYLKYLNVAYLHGKMPSQEKERVMKGFAAGEIHVLVATTVIEVGINVPNATIMIIENAEKFGLSQLHQLRGRVGRGNKKSFCFLVSDFDGETRKRLENFCSTTDGFEISKQDLEIRGPGDLFGKRQHGLPALKLANLSDMQSLEKAQNIAKKITETPNWYKKPEYKSIANAVVRFFSNTSVI